MIAQASRVQALDARQRGNVLRVMSRAAMLSDGLGVAGGLRRQAARVIMMQGIMSNAHALHTAKELAKAEASTSS